MNLSIKIEGIGTYVPKKVVSNDFFIDHFRREENGNIEVNGLMKSLGRDERHFAERGESSLSMGYLPEQLSEEDCLHEVEKLLSSVQDLPKGKCIGFVIKELNGKADKKLIKQCIDTLLK